MVLRALTITGIQTIARDPISHLEIQVLVIPEGVMGAVVGATKRYCEGATRSCIIPNPLVFSVHLAYGL